MNTITSSDGTKIVFDRIGTGPAVVLVDGALCSRTAGPNGPLAALLANRFTVYTYDRRGRGESGDTAPYTVEREVEDLAALINEAGGSIALYSISSGAALALEAANSGLPVTKLAVYEAPFVVDDTRPPVPADFVAQLDRMIAEDRRGDAVKAFMSSGVRLPAMVVSLMRLLPAWTRLKGVAHTLPYDMRIMGDTQGGKPLPADRWAAVTVPTLVIDGGKSPQWMRNGMQALADVLPNAQHRTLAGQTHLVKAKALAPVLTEFFTKQGAS
jgi:pimeloyl-ACP methyl ester carboxylesterase